MQGVLNKLCQETGAHFHPEDFDAGTTFIPNIEQYFTVRQKEAARQSMKRDVVKRRLSMSDVNGPPNSPRSGYASPRLARLNSANAGTGTRSREGSLGSVRSEESAKAAQQAALVAAVQAEADAMSTITAMDSTDVAVLPV